MPADKLHRRRFLLNHWLKQLPVKTGDVFFRMGADTFYGFPFDMVVGLVTKSKFSHASVALVENDSIFLVEVDLNGTTQERFIDWVDDCATNDVQIWRPDVTRLGLDFPERIERSLRKFLATDGEYDLQFRPEPGRHYCTESVDYIFQEAGCPPLCQALLAREVMQPWAYYSLFLPINYLSGILTGASMPTDQGIIFVGNEKQGLMSSDFLYPVFKHS